jgi:hypothetical protein
VNVSAQTINPVPEDNRRFGQLPSATERSPEFSKPAELEHEPKRGTLQELMAALEQREITEEQFLAELLQENRDEQSMSTGEPQGNVEEETIKGHQDELEYGDAGDCS